MSKLASPAKPPLNVQDGLAGQNRLRCLVHNTSSFTKAKTSMTNPQQFNTEQHGRAWSAAYHGRGMRFAIVAARFNDFITNRLVEGALAAFRLAGVEHEVPVVHVPGAFELPVVAKKMALTGQFDAILALGAVIRGDTAHFDFVAGECARGLMQGSLDTGIPLLFGVLTTENVDQAWERVGGRMAPDPAVDDNHVVEGNKGAECAYSAIETVEALQQVSKLSIGKGK